jgi:hypothetical protein
MVRTEAPNEKWDEVPCSVPSQLPDMYYGCEAEHGCKRHSSPGGWIIMIQLERL